MTEPYFELSKKIIRYSWISIGVLAFIYICVFGVKFWTGNQQTWGVFGDFFGGTLNAVFGLFTIILVYANLRISEKQQQINSESEDVHRLINSNRDILKNLIANDIRDSGWFALHGPEALKSIMDENLDGHIRDEIAVRMIGKLNQMIPKLSESLVMKYFGEIGKRYHPNERVQILASRGTAIQRLFEDFSPFELIKQNFYGVDLEKEIFDIATEILPFEENCKVLEAAFEKFYRDRGYLFGHYIRNHYYLLDYIKSQSKLINANYFSRLSRSYLSSSEILLIFHNCFFSKSTKKYRELIIDFEILDDVEIQPFLYQKYFFMNKSKILAYFKREV